MFYSLIFNRENSKKKVLVLAYYRQIDVHNTKSAFTLQVFYVRYYPHQHSTFTFQRQISPFSITGAFKDVSNLFSFFRKETHSIQVLVCYYV